MLAPMLRAPLSIVLISLSLIGCGAKSGLYVPDASIDAGVDAAPEAAAEASTPEAPDVVCIEVLDPTAPVTAALSLPVRLRALDVMLLIDATASMVDEIGNVRSRLVSRVLPGIRATVPDVELGLAFAGEFPEEPHGPSSVSPYELRAPVGTAPLQLEGALDGVPRWGNFDDPEAQVEGLYQIATGEGLTPYIEPAFGCVSGGLGGACFRQDAFSVIVLITDAPMHNGPPGIAPEAPYRFRPAPHSYAETLEALRRHSLVVVGLGARDSDSPSPMPHLRALARDTGAVDARGQPLVFDIGGTGDRTGDGLVEALVQLAEELPLDVTARVVDVPGDPVDARDLVEAVRPLNAQPPSGAEKTPSGFERVRPGTEVRFELVLSNAALDSVAPGSSVRASVLFETGRSLLGEREVVIAVGKDARCP